MSGRPFTKRIKYTFIYFFVRFLIFSSTLVPRTWWIGMTGVLGRFAYYVAGKTRALAIGHLTLVFGREKSASEIRRLAKNMFRMLGKNAGEILRARSVKTPEQLYKFLTLQGYENVVRALEVGKGIVFLTCHLGAFDLQIMVMAMKGLKPYIIGTPAKDERLNELLFEYRNMHGAVAVERGKEMFRLIKALKTGGSVAILIDQDTKVKSRFVDFFGMPAATPVGAAILAMKTGATVLPTYVHLGPDNLQHMHILEPIPCVVTGDDEKDMVVNTQNYSRFIEQQVRTYPEQWVWMHERWKTKPGEEVQ